MDQLIDLCRHFVRTAPAISQSRLRHADRVRVLRFLDSAAPSSASLAKGVTQL